MQILSQYPKWFLYMIKLYLKVLAIMIDADGLGTISSRKVTHKKGMNVCMKFYITILKI